MALVSSSAMAIEPDSRRAMTQARPSKGDSDPVRRYFAGNKMVASQPLSGAAECVSVVQPGSDWPRLAALAWAIQTEALPPCSA